MITISREEAKIIRKILPEAHIAVTNRQGPSRKKTIYMEESRAAMKAIKELREKGGMGTDGALSKA